VENQKKWNGVCNLPVFGGIAALPWGWTSVDFPPILKRNGGRVQLSATENVRDMAD